MPRCQDQDINDNATTKLRTIRMNIERYIVLFFIMISRGPRRLVALDRECYWSIQHHG